MKTPPQIFGREPAVYTGLIESLLTVLLAFGIGITQTSYAPWVALVVAIGGAYTAWATKDTLLGAATGIVKAVIVLVAVYGLTLTDSQAGAVIALTSVVVGFFQRTQTSPEVVAFAAPKPDVKPDGSPYITGP